MYLTIIGSLMMIAAWNLCYWFQRRRLGEQPENSRPEKSGITWIELLTTMFTVCALLTFSWLLLLIAVLLIIVVGVGNALQVRRRVFLLWSFIVTLPVWGLDYYFGMQNVDRMARLRDQYPIESMADRLAYEQPATTAEDSSSDVTAATDETVSMTPISDDEQQALTARWTEFETHLKQIGSSGRRVWALQWVHNASIDHFNRSPGFGVVRSVRPNEYWLERNEAPPVWLPPAEETPSTSATPDLANINPDVPARGDGTNSPPWPNSDTLWETHTSGVLDFVNPEGFGWIKQRRQVAGFEPHRFSGMPSLSGEMDFAFGSEAFDAKSIDPQRNEPWRLTRLDLVSLLKHPEPRVYVSEHLPRMEELSSENAPTRPTDPFEAGALLKLQSGEDLVIDEEVNRLRMVGSLRAVKACLDCHEADHGKLLGAFSYEFRRVPAMPPIEPGKKPQARRDGPHMNFNRLASSESP